MSTVQEIEAAIRELSPSELAQVRQFVVGLQEAPAGEALACSPYVKPAPMRNLNEQQKAYDAWVGRLRTWSDSHPPVTHFVDDSRESIYEGRGE